jgi:hypothetical protein
MVEIDRPKQLIIEIDQTTSTHSINLMIGALRFDFKEVVKSIKRLEE